GDQRASAYSQPVTCAPVVSAVGSVPSGWTIISDSSSPSRCWYDSHAPSGDQSVRTRSRPSLGETQVIPRPSVAATYTRSTATSAEVNPSCVPSVDHTALAPRWFTIGRSPETSVGRPRPSAAATLRLIVASA